MSNFKPTFNTLENWTQSRRTVTFQGESYSWSKRYEFMKFIDLPALASQQFELALSSYSDADKQMLEGKGWKVGHALDLSLESEPYREYIRQSRGEFTVAKDQNARLL